MSNCTKDAGNVYTPFVIVWGRKRTLADNTVYPNVSIEISFDPSLFSLGSNFNRVIKVFSYLIIYVAKRGGISKDDRKQ